MRSIKENKNTLKEMRCTLNDCLNSLRLLEGKRKVREMARTIKDYDTFEGKGCHSIRKIGPSRSLLAS